MQFSLLSSSTLASDYAFPLHLSPRQSSFFCIPVFLLYPDTWKTCGNGYISPDCNCCNGGLIGCLISTQTCAVGATGVAICCDNTAPDCPPVSGGGGGCATQGKVSCGNGCLPAGYKCCDPDLGGCSSEQYCCSNPDGTPACCVGNTDISSSSNTATEQSPTSTESFNFETGSSTTTSVKGTLNGATSTEQSPTSTESFNFETGSSITTSAKGTSNSATSTAIPSPSSSVGNSSSTRLCVVRTARGLHSFIFQSAMPVIVIYYLVLVGIFA